MSSTFPEFANLDEVQHWAMKLLLDAGAKAAPRGFATLEALATGFTLRNPRARGIGNSVRKWSAALAIGEFAWHVSGSDEVAPLVYYAPRWREFSDDGLHINGSCYGHRIFAKKHKTSSQWDRLVDLMRSDPGTRRAVLSVQQTPERLLDPSSKDVPCVSDCQFLLRDGRLDAIVHMRSNDVVWGLPYDLFLFTMLQEMLAVHLRVQLGQYHHFAGSFHLYERHVDLAQRIVQEGPGYLPAMSPMENLDDLPSFLAVERQLRETGVSEQPLKAFWAALAEPLREHAALCGRQVDVRA